MTLPRLPGPQSDDEDPAPEQQGASPQSTAEGAQRAQRPRRQGPLPTAEDCLRGLHSLTQLVMLGLVAPAKANCVRGNLRDILAHLRHQQTDTSGPRLPLADLRRLLQASPHLVSLLDPLLSPEQIEELLREGDDGND